MPLTPAEKQRRYREKLKRENPDKYKEMKKKTAECALRYYRRKVSHYTENKKEERRQIWRDERKKQKYNNNNFPDETKIEKKSATQKVTILSEIRNSPYNKRYFDMKQFPGLQLKKRDLNFDLCAAKRSLDVSIISEENIDLYKNPVASTSKVYKTGDYVEKKDYDFDLIHAEDNNNGTTKDDEGKYECNSDMENININQNVLVRYFNRNNWKYYIGRVIKIYKEEEEKKYRIIFLKTMKKPILKFVVPTKIDQDDVPFNSIVKPIELNTFNKDEFLLKYDSDNIYF